MKAPGDSINPHAVVMHRTIGHWAGDYAVLGRSREPSVQFLVGQDQGQWVQYYDTLVGCNHACDAKSWSVGIEFSGQNGETLTDWQVLAGAIIASQLLDAHGIDYRNQYRQPANMIRRLTDWHGWLNHNDVLATTKGCDQHFDYVNPSDVDRIVGMADVLRNTPSTLPPRPASIPIVKELDMASIKNALITLEHKGLGQYEGSYDPEFGRDPIIVGCVGLGPFPEADGWWGESNGATFRAQPRAGKVVVTANAPHTTKGDPLQVFVTVA